MPSPDKPAGHSVPQLLRLQFAAAMAGRRGPEGRKDRGPAEVSLRVDFRPKIDSYLDETQKMCLSPFPFERKGVCFSVAGMNLRFYATFRRIAEEI